MSGSAVRAWFTPGVIIQLVGMALVGLTLWFGNKADVRSLGEEQTRQGAQIKDVRDSIREVAQKIPDGEVINLRLATLERKADSFDPSMLIGMKADLELLKGRYGEYLVFKDQVKGRIWGVRSLPYREKWAQE